MALLKLSTLRPAHKLALLALLAGGTACVLMKTNELAEPRFAFPHKTHVAEGLDCSDCHAGVPDTDEPRMPVQQQCQLCHKDLDAEKPPEKQAARLFEGGMLQASHYSRLSPERIFSHAKHAAAVEKCDTCHTGVSDSDRVSPGVALTMAECMACHAERRVSNDCATCHREISTQWAPESHEHNWRRWHGSVVRNQGTALADQCSMCHTESSCTACHRDQPPQSHNNAFRLRGHGMVAAIDRQNCMTCHKPDSCQSCHAEMQPLSHRGAWDSGVQTHCLSCHQPLQSQNCGVCHKSTPGHALAAPLPPDHTPGMNCRQCHGVTQPLPHVDNGDNCNQCHH